jgi:hypothetical protein
MENGIAAYSMCLGRLWFKQMKVHHNWGDNILTIIFEDKIVMFNIIKHVNIKSSHNPKIWIMNLIGNKCFLNIRRGNCLEQFQNYGKVTPKELYFLLEIDYKMLQPKQKNEYLVSFYEH